MPSHSQGHDQRCQQTLDWRVRWVGYPAALVGTVLIGLRIIARTT